MYLSNVGSFFGINNITLAGIALLLIFILIRIFTTIYHKRVEKDPFLYETLKKDYIGRKCLYYSKLFYRIFIELIIYFSTIIMIFSFFGGLVLIAVGLTYESFV